MESKQTTPEEQVFHSSDQSRTIREMSDRLSDINLKLDHIIERIKDSLHRMKSKEQDDWEEMQ